jgi:DNA sulfur modification protein DndE
MMTMRRFTALFLLLFSVAGAKSQVIDKDLNYFYQKSPFAMPVVKEPSFRTATYSIVNFGAIADGKTLNTAAIQQAIIKCNQEGGGKVIIPAGTWLSAPIELLSNVNLVVEKGAVLQFTPDRKQYPIIKAGKNSNSFTVASPIYAYSAKNIAITGEGIVDGAGESWRPVKKSKVAPGFWDKLVKSGGTLSSDGKIWWPSYDAMNGETYLETLKSKGKEVTADDYLPARDFMRPYMLLFADCEKILIENVTLRNSPKFVFYPSRCTDITIRGANVFNDPWAQNGDGIDISACRNVVIFNTTVSVGDDAICMKSSRGKSDVGEAMLQNILIANCKVYTGHGGFVIGSNTDGGMKNIFVSNCEFNGTDIGIRVKSNSGRGGRVEQIFIDSIVMDNIKNEAISFDTYYEDVTAGKEKGDVVTTAVDKVPEFTAFRISNITCKKAKVGLYINGLSYMPVHDINLVNINLTSDKSAEINYAKNIIGTNIVFNAKKSAFTLKSTESIVFNGQEVK